MPEPKSKNRFFNNWQPILLGIAFGLLLSEAALRIMVKLNVFKADSRYAIFLKEIAKDSLCRISNDPVLGFEFIPNSRRDFASINSGGFRGKEYSYETPPGTVRIAILGDSESVGLVLREEDTLSGCLGKALNEAAHNKKYEVLEFGFPGYNIRQKERILQTRVMRYQPSIVIFYYVLNDPDPHPDTALIKPSPFLKSYLYVFLRFHRDFARPSMWQLTHRSRNLVRLFQKLHASADFERCKDMIRQMAAFLHKRNVRFILVIAPELICYDDFKDYPYRNIHNKLLGLASEEIEVFDPLEDLAASGFKPTELWITPFDCHKGGEANRIIAKGLSRKISN